jgi:hypothetical protein
MFLILTLIEYLLTQPSYCFFVSVHSFNKKYKTLFWRKKIRRRFFFNKNLKDTVSINLSKLFLFYFIIVHFFHKFNYKANNG